MLVIYRSVTITEGKKHDVTVGRMLNFPKGSMVAIDIAYNDYAWYKQLTDRDIFFVTRLKNNAKYRIIDRHYVFLTNKFKLAVKTIADIYKARWHVELFFK